MSTVKKGATYFFSGELRKDAKITQASGILDCAEDMSARDFYMSCLDTIKQTMVERAPQFKDEKLLLFAFNKIGD